jgi:hypothetical protein
MKKSIEALSARVPFACVCSVGGVVNEHIDLRVTGIPPDGQINHNFRFYANGKDNMTLSEVRSKFRVLKFDAHCNVFYHTLDGRYISLNKLLSNNRRINRRDLPSKDMRDIGTAFQDGDMIRKVKASFAFSSCKLMIHEGMTLKLSDE